MKMISFKVTKANLWLMVGFYFSVIVCGLFVWALIWLINNPVDAPFSKGLLTVFFPIAAVAYAYLAGACFKRAQLLNELEEAKNAFFNYSGGDPKVIEELERRFVELRLKAGKSEFYGIIVKL